jgi:glycosyltransferase involved in cell wall biosynthesis
MLVTHDYGPETGPVGRRWDTVIAGLRQADYRVTVVAAQKRGQRPSRPQTVQGIHGETVAEVRRGPEGDGLRDRILDQVAASVFSFLWGLRLWPPSDRPRAVIGTAPALPSAFAAWALSRVYGAALVIDMRDAWPDLIAHVWPTADAGRRRGWWAQRVTQDLVVSAVTWLERVADVVVVTSEAFADVLRSRGIRRVLVIRNSAASCWTEPAHRQAPGLRVVYAGTVGRAQDLDTIVRAAHEVEVQGQSIRVRIAGRGSQLDNVRQLVHALGAPVVFEPWRPQAEVPALYEWADTIVVSLRGWRPLEWTVPSKLLEALASGRPVSACARGETAQLISTLGAGAVVEPGDWQGLAQVWGQWAASGPPPPCRAAQDWAARHSTDGLLADRYEALLRIVTRSPR